MELSFCPSIVCRESSSQPCLTSCPLPILSSGCASFSSCFDGLSSTSSASRSLFVILPQRCSLRFLDPEATDRWRLRPRAALTSPPGALMENAIPPKHDNYTVGDFMTKEDELFVVQPSTTVDEALEILVKNRITGLPVVDDIGKLIGVVSDYDLLALDSISGKRTSSNSLFPEPGSTWKAFKEIQKLLSKTQGKTVGEVMTPSPLVVREMTNLEDAARLLLESKYRRLPVVDDAGKLVGLLTRGNVVRAALEVRHATDMGAVGP